MHDIVKSNEIMMLSVDDVTFAKELYPRLKPNDAAIERYRASIELLPPIIVARGRLLVDGFHRWQAHRREGIAEINAIDLGNLSDIEIKKEAYRRNKEHGVQLETGDKRRGADDLYRSGVTDYEEIADLIGVTLKTAKEYCRDARRDAVDQQKQTAWDLWLNCLSYRAIGEQVGVNHETVGKWIGDISNGLENSPPASRQHFDMWQFHVADKDAGAQSYFGAIPPQVVENLLWFYTEPGQIVVDLFAGSGTTIDVAKAMGRRVWASDRLGNKYCPHLPIHQHDVAIGWPGNAPSKADLVLLDPPYWKQAKGRYSDDPEDLANQSIENFNSSWANAVAAILPHCSRAAYIVSSTRLDDGSVVDHATDMRNPFFCAGWRVEQRVIVPYQTQQVTGQQVEWAREKKRMLNLYRDLVVLTP